jgi:uncharacterized membrane protein
MPPTTPSTPEVKNEHKTPHDPTVMGVLAYLGPLVLVPLLAAKDDAFAQFHARQGILIFAVEVIVYVLSGMLLYGFFFLWQLISLINLACLVFSIIGIVNVIQKKETPLPIIGHLTKYLPF